MQRDIKATRRDLLKAMAAWTAAATFAGCSNNSWLRQLAQSGVFRKRSTESSDLRPWVRYPEKTDLLMLADRPLFWKLRFTTSSATLRPTMHISSAGIMRGCPPASTCVLFGSR
jgi:hypothetical protein